jgi:CheY-like chemotaxis protein
LRNARLLVVDDDNDARELFTYMLTRSGAVVNTAPSVDAALQLLESRQYDVLLADIGMPGRDGYALIKEVREHPNAAIRCLPTVAITSYAGDQYRMRTAAAGFDGYVTKPVESDHLARVVADLLKQPRSIERATQRGEATPHMLDV